MDRKGRSRNLKEHNFEFMRLITPLRVYRTPLSFPSHVKCDSGLIARQLNKNQVAKTCKSPKILITSIASRRFNIRMLWIKTQLQVCLHRYIHSYWQSGGKIDRFNTNISHVQGLQNKPRENTRLIRKER